MNFSYLFLIFILPIKCVDSDPAYKFMPSTVVTMGTDAQKYL